MIDIIIYTSGYVLVSKLIECQRDKFIKDCLGETPIPKQVTVLKPVDLKKHPGLKQHIID